MSFEILEPNFERNNLIIMSQQQQKAVSEFKYLHNQVKQDPSSAVMGMGNFLLPSSFVVPYWQEPEKKLRSSFFVDRPTSNAYFELGILEPDGEMSLTIAENELMLVDFAADPFSQLILGYFRNQYCN